MYQPLVIKNTGLKPKVIEQIKNCLKQFSEIQLAVLYGSRATGKYKPGSDIDICLFGGETLNMNTILRLDTQLDDLLLPYTFDLSIYSQIDNPKLRDHIDRVGIELYNTN